ncbi:MAG TPA: peptidyl-alpha-hydroxyglycine alpha-amidating lyase family protein [Pyrinomonadaceae bacterium]|nr:peptidyl-alpha-hydroxyglycine alpha-amidating lyase family protein [Pyrinomonadaceae bacterium]
MTSVVKTDAEIARRFVANAASIRTLLIASFLLGIAGVSGNAQPPPPSSKTSLTNSPSPHYHVVHSWPVLPENTILDEVSAVAVDSNDDVLVLKRGGRKWPDSGPFDTSPIPAPTVFVFDGRTGRLLKKWGEKILALPHSITVDSKDNIWIADVVLHQVFKFSHDGKLLLKLGERAVAGDDTSHFNQPSDVAVAPDGSFYVSDGYGNNRVVKFGADGKFLLQWGTKGKNAGQFDLPHALTFDRGRVYVLDRGNRRVQIFDSQGNYLTEWKGPPFASLQDIKIGHDGLAFVVQMGLGPDKFPDVTGLLVMRSDGSLVTRTGRYGNYDGQFLDVHWVAVAKSGAVYTADFGGRRVQKFVRGKN